MQVSHSFRQSMATVHTWCGISVGTLLFVIFWMGTLSVFDVEIDQWMKPELRISSTEKNIPLDDAINKMLAIKPEGARALSISPPNDRQSTFELWFRGGKGVVFPRHYINPGNGEFIEPTQSLGGTGFLYRLHHRLNLTWNNMGTWVVGFAAMSMLLLLVTSVFTHRKVINELFTFRPKKSLGRSTLDLHTLTGLMALPFYFMVVLSGLIIPLQTYFPWATTVLLNGDKSATTIALRGGMKILPANIINNELVSIDQMVVQAEDKWSKLDDGKPVRVDAIRVGNLGDENSFVRLRRIFADNRVMMNREQMIFDASSGELLYDYVAGPIVTVSSWIKGMHYIQYEHWPLRWLHFLGGLSGCVMIATGLIFWQRTRRKKHGEELLIHNIVNTVTIGTICGTILATGVFLLTNRLLPKTVELYSFDRSELEVLSFYIVWMASFLHAGFRRKTVWREQSILIALITLAAPILNWMTTGDNPIETLHKGILSVFGVDMVLILSAVMATVIAVRIQKFDSA
jgi:uncharacterized iron-regulated membrane protein